MRSSTIFEGIPERIDEIRRREGREQPVPPPTRRGIQIQQFPIMMVRAENAPRDEVGLLRLKPEPSLSVSRKPHFIVGKICAACPLTRCRCHPHLPTHWGRLFDELA